MTTASDFTTELETKVAQQLKSQRVGYLLGAGASYLNGTGYWQAGPPRAGQLHYLGSRRAPGQCLSRQDVDGESRCTCQTVMGIRV